MAQPVSPFKILDRVFKPDYILAIQYPDESRQVVITTLSMYNPKFRKEQVEPFPVTRDDLTIRKYYKPIIEKTNYVMEPKMLIGTVEGKATCAQRFLATQFPTVDVYGSRHDAIIPEFINVNAIQMWLNTINYT